MFFATSVLPLFCTSELLLHFWILRYYRGDVEICNVIQFLKVTIIAKLVDYALRNIIQPARYHEKDSGPFDP